MKPIICIVTIITMTCLFVCCESKSGEIALEQHHEDEEGIVVLSEAQFNNSGVALGVVEMKNLSSVIPVNGVLDVPPQNMVSVSPVMGGFIKTTELLQGMKVRKGQVIATVQNPDFIRIQSEFLENTHKLKYLEQEYKRQEELAEENIAAGKIFQQISAEYQTMKVTIGGLEEQLKILNINPLTLTSSNIRSIVNIYSPISGYVTAVNVNIGKFVNPQDVICEIVDTDHLHAELTVFEKNISKVKKGQKIRFVLVNESGRERTASVYLINHQISAERTVRVHAHLDKEDPALMPNMYLKALIEVGESNKTTALPDEAIVSAGEKNYVFITGEHPDSVNDKTENQYVFRAVEIKKGVTENGFTEVLLPADFVLNTPVVIKGSYSLLSKMSNSGEHEH